MYIVLIIDGSRCTKSRCNKERPFELFSWVLVTASCMKQENDSVPSALFLTTEDINWPLSKVYSHILRGQSYYKGG